MKGFKFFLLVLIMNVASSYHALSQSQSTFGFYTINYSTKDLCFIDSFGNIEVIGNTNIPVITDYYQSLEFDKNNNLWFLNRDSLYLVNINTGICQKTKLVTYTSIPSNSIGLGFSFNSSNVPYIQREIPNTQAGTLCSTNNFYQCIATPYINNTGVPSILGIEFDDGDNLWAIDEYINNKLFKINLSSGQVIPNTYPSYGSDFNAADLDYSNGTLYGIAQFTSNNYATSEFFKINTITGEKTALFTLNEKFTGIAGGYKNETIVYDTMYISGQLPTIGLVGYYPFNGNANDLSVNLKHGTVHGATLTSDRFYNPNAAYYFDGVNDYISIPDSFMIGNDFSLSFWAQLEDSIGLNNILSDGSSNYGSYDFLIGFRDNSIRIRADKQAPLNFEDNIEPSLGSLQLINNWVNVVWVMKPTNSEVFLNGSLISTINIAGSNVGYHDSISIIGGRRVWGIVDSYFKGKIDDIAFYNRSLTSTEIANIYAGNLCFETIYDTIIVDVPVYDTIQVTIPIYDTITTYVSVTDTLFIDVLLSDTQILLSQIKVFPNPTSEILFIDYGSYLELSDYSIEISNSIGQIVFTSPVVQQIQQVPLNGWTGYGTYYLHLFKQGLLVETKIIILH